MYAEFGVKKKVFLVFDLITIIVLNGCYVVARVCCNPNVCPEAPLAPTHKKVIFSGAVATTAVDVNVSHVMENTKPT